FQIMFFCKFFCHGKRICVGKSKFIKNVDVVLVFEIILGLFHSCIRISRIVDFKKTCKCCSCVCCTDLHFILHHGFENQSVCCHIRFNIYCKVCVILYQFFIDIGHCFCFRICLCSNCDFVSRTS